MQEEIFYENNLEKQLPTQLFGTEFKKEINDNGNYYVCFLNLQVYITDSKTSCIENYDDFLNSDCKLIVLFSDNEFIEIYMKENELKEKIMQNIVSKGIQYEIKTKGNDGYGFKLGDRTEILYRNPSFVEDYGVPGGTFISIKKKNGDRLIRIDWYPKDGYHIHPPTRRK